MKEIGGSFWRSATPREEDNRDEHVQVYGPAMVMVVIFAVPRQLCPVIRRRVLCCTLELRHAIFFLLFLFARIQGLSFMLDIYLRMFCRIQSRLNFIE
jgi:hypothetical protein